MKEELNYYKELEEMDLKEVIELVGSRARRYLKRNNMNSKFIKKVLKAKKELKEGKKVKVIKTHLRSMVVLPIMVGLNIGVHNGKTFEVIKITHEMIGHRLGEFAMTRKRVIHGKAGIGATRSSTAIASRKK